MDDDLPDLDAITSGSITVDGSTLVLAGDVDFALVNAWERTGQAIDDLERIVAERVTFMGSAGITLVIKIARAAEPRTVELVHPSRPALRPLQAMGVDKLLRITT